MDHQPTSIVTPLKRARGLGPAHDGTHHFWVQRASAVLLAPLTLWMVVRLASFLGSAQHAQAVSWLADPLHGMLMGALVLALTVHARAGLNTVIEDYVHAKATKIVLLLLTQGALYACALAALFSILHVQGFSG